MGGDRVVGGLGRDTVVGGLGRDREVVGLGRTGGAERRNIFFLLEAFLEYCR